MLAQRRVAQEDSTIRERFRRLDLQLGPNASVEVERPIFLLTAADRLNLRPRRLEGEDDAAARSLLFPGARVNQLRFSRAGGVSPLSAPTALFFLGIVGLEDHILALR